MNMNELKIKQNPNKIRLNKTHRYKGNEGVVEQKELMRMLWDRSNE